MLVQFLQSCLFYFHRTEWCLPGTAFMILYAIVTFVDGNTLIFFTLSCAYRTLVDTSPCRLKTSCIASSVDQLVRMTFKSLLSFFDAPDLNATHGQIFCKKRCFWIVPPKTVQHKRQEGYQIFQLGILLNLLEHPPITWQCFKTGDSFLAKFFHNCPTMDIRKLFARLSLHRNIIFMQLLISRNR